MKKNDRPYVVYWNNIPAPYMVERFNALAQRGNVEFEAWFNDRTEVGRSWKVEEYKWLFPFRYLPSMRISKHILHWPSPVFGRKPDIMVSLYAEPVFLLGWCIAKLRGSKTCFRVLKTFDRLVKRHPAKEALKHILFRCVDGVETPGKDGKSFALRYGTPADRIFFATHTVDIRHFRVKTAIARANRDALRTRLTLQGTVFIYVGRLWHGKGLDTLLSAFARIQTQGNPRVSLLIVGDGPEEIRLRQIAENLNIKNLVFTGFQPKNELANYFAAADVFVFPTLGDTYGVAIDEAMASGLPVITSNAVGEIHERIEDGLNGFIIPPEDDEILADRMLRLSSAPEKCQIMGKISEAKVSGNTPAQWAVDFELMIRKMLKIEITG